MDNSPLRQPKPLILSPTSEPAPPAQSPDPLPHLEPLIPGLTLQPSPMHPNPLHHPEPLPYPQTPHPQFRWVTGIKNFLQLG
uniref:Uncharacterized protein n=1 Tax=Chelonoidis abingdonii TaxID=106734 RepID=A0A8C0J7X7_CHEAB